jgi:hypothetical protein
LSLFEYKPGGKLRSTKKKLSGKLCFCAPYTNYGKAAKHTCGAHKPETALFRAAIFTPSQFGKA